MAGDFYTDAKKFFQGKKITMLGLGVLGRGAGVAKFLAECGAQLTITDLKTKKDLAPSLTRLKKFKGITYVLGAHDMADFQNADMIIKAAGVPFDSEYINEAKKRGIPVEMDASCFAKFFKGTIIGVTGTRGKTTTTFLIHEILKKAKKKVYLGGNIQGVATLPLLKKVKKGDIVLCELDSWQLQGFGDAKVSPQIAIFTNFYEDHMNYYGGDMKRYFGDKANIFLYQKKDDVLICGEGVGSSITTKSKKITAKKEDIPRNWKLKLRGEHNRENASYAYHAGKVLGMPESVIKKVLETFPGVPGRLELIGAHKGVHFCNDTTATVPLATQNAICALEEKPIILITGGTDKNLKYEDLAKDITRSVKELVFLPGTATEKIKKSLPQKFRYKETRSMKEAVSYAFKKAKKGDVILLSPGAASFGLFKNEYDRGEKFLTEIKRLKKRK
jgi:UDP-N-acetylmuramoylalanine--D-glutamate ligase